MTRSMKSVWLFAALLLVTFVVQEGSAAACTQQCVQVVGAPLFCRECRDVGTFTGITCASAGPCSCYFVQNNCWGQAASAKTATELRDSIFAPSLSESAAAPAQDLAELAAAR